MPEATGASSCARPGADRPLHGRRPRTGAGNEKRRAPRPERATGRSARRPWAVDRIEAPRSLGPDPTPETRAERARSRRAARAREDRRTRDDGPIAAPPPSADAKTARRAKPEVEAGPRNAARLDGASPTELARPLLRVIDVLRGSNVSAVELALAISGGHAVEVTVRRMGRAFEVELRGWRPDRARAASLRSALRARLGARGDRLAGLRCRSAAGPRRGPT